METFATPERFLTTRYAIYACPDPGSHAGRAAAEWLGRCPRSGPRSQPAIPGLAPALLRTVTHAPRRHGFHATLKAPFRLAPGATRGRLVLAIAQVARQVEPFEGPQLELGLLGGCLALVPVARDAHVEALAARCVAELDRFRAPVDPSDYAAVEADSLSPRHRALLERWGYPFVMDTYRFHYKLTGPVASFEEAVVDRVADAGRAHFGPLLRSLRRIEALALFEERHSAHDLRLVQRFPLGEVSLPMAEAVTGRTGAPVPRTPAG